MAGFATIEAVGLSWDDVTNKLMKSLKAANKTVGTEISKVGKKAMLDDTRSRRGSLRFAGQRLNVRTKVKASTSKATVDFRGQPAGAWAIISTGTKAHQIRVKSARALHWGADGYARFVQHPGTAGGGGGRGGYWGSAGKALDKAVDKVIEKHYDKALT